MQEIYKFQSGMHCAFKIYCIASASSLQPSNDIYILCETAATMSTPANARDLHLALLANLRKASEKRDADALMAWYSKDATFHDGDKCRTLSPS